MRNMKINVDGGWTRKEVNMKKVSWKESAEVP
jgi:hypothetical protein